MKSPKKKRSNRKSLQLQLKSLNPKLRRLPKRSLRLLVLKLVILNSRCKFFKKRTTSSPSRSTWSLKKLDLLRKSKRSFNLKSR